MPFRGGGDAFGKRLGPKEPWGAWGKMIEGDPDPNSKQHGGLAAITMKQNKRPDDRAGFVQVRLEGLPNSPKSILMHVNDHYVLEGDVQDTSKAIEVLEQCWGASLKYSEFIINETTQQIIEKRLS